MGRAADEKRVSRLEKHLVSAVPGPAPATLTAPNGESRQERMRRRLSLAFPRSLAAPVQPVRNRLQQASLDRTVTCLRKGISRHLGGGTIDMQSEELGRVPWDTTKRADACSSVS